MPDDSSERRDVAKSKCEIGRITLPDDSERYCPLTDPDSEQGIAQYVEGQAKDETVKHVERVKQEFVLGDAYEVWDVTTDKRKWWVITNLTNLYSQDHFPTLDYTLSFHVGLMMRLRSQPEGPVSSDPSPFDDVFRRQEQAKARFDGAVEAEDYQAVGMQLRECLISLVAAVRRRTNLSSTTEKPQDANVIAWTELLIGELCPDSSNKELRQHLRSLSKDTWQLVNWLTHHRNATEMACSIAIHSCDTVVGHFIQILERTKADGIDQCPRCKSRNVRMHFDPTIEPDGDYYKTCGVCTWSSHADFEADGTDWRVPHS